MNKAIVPILIYLFHLSCKAQHSGIPEMDKKQFNEFWFQGKAEISSYTLSQSRYGAVHDGEAVLIFVTEDLSKAKHVKLDDPTRYPNDAVKVLKLNMTKEFVTGSYKYSMMSSVFTPIDYAKHPHSLKLTASSQDWCGQSFMQAVYKGNRYEVQQFSYFESEGDAQFSWVSTFLEDEIWTKIRIAPHTLPIGKIDMVPAAFYIRLSHRDNKVYEAITSLQTILDEYTYTIAYPELERTLEIRFQKNFPYKISGWKESYGKDEVTTAELTETVITDYWNHHLPIDEPLRDSLRLKN